MGNRAPVQAAEAELPPEVFLWRKRQRHKDTGMGDAYRKPAADGTAEAHQTHVELLRTGHNGQDHAHVLRQLLHFLRESGKGLGRNA